MPQFLSDRPTRRLGLTTGKMGGRYNWFDG